MGELSLYNVLPTTEVGLGMFYCKAHLGRINFSFLVKLPGGPLIPAFCQLGVSRTGQMDDVTKLGQQSGGTCLLSMGGAMPVKHGVQH